MRLANDSSDEEVKDKATVVYTSERVVENIKDDLATSTVQIDTAIENDARTIFENALKGKFKLLVSNSRRVIFNVA